MTIKYSVSGAKARNGKEIAPMAFSDRAEAERFAKYHEGLSVPQNLRKHPGSVQAFSTDHKDFEPTAEQTKAAEKFFASPAESATTEAVLSALIKSGEEFVIHSPFGQSFGRVHRRTFEEGGVERKSPPVTVVIDPKVFMASVEEHTGPVQILKLPIVLGGVRPLETTATVGNPNADLEAAYEMGYKLAVANSFWKGCTDKDIETQDYVDQRRSDLKELVSYDRSR